MSEGVRIVTLDYLRGACAFGVMLYHLVIWTYGAMGAETFLSRFGIYAVSIFYFISGAAMYMAYMNMNFSLQSLKKFAVKRIARIFPLLWLTVLLTVIGASQRFSFEKILLNVTGLFSIFAPDQYLAGGSWSIGNELCYYLLFPFLIWLIRSRKGMCILILTVVGLHLYYAFSRLEQAGGTFLELWPTYVEPLNHLLFFIFGLLTSMLLLVKIIPKWAATFGLMACSIPFILLPYSGDKSIIVTGEGRVIFTFLACGISFFIAQLFEVVLPKKLAQIMKWLGEISYSVYLLHPIVFAAIGIIIGLIGFSEPNPVIDKVVLGLTITGTLVVSHFVYNYFELPAARLGRNLLPEEEIRNKSAKT